IMTNFQETTLLSYPRQRKPLSDRFQAIYADVYKTSRNGRSILFRRCNYFPLSIPVSSFEFV
ncbi:MAG: hypothetical protein LBG58_09700, partial [Planctomycetaceae bacterium]|nr:hypothetical protein [Planctomycetaceae bacterium]